MTIPCVCTICKPEEAIKEEPIPKSPEKASSNEETVETKASLKNAPKVEVVHNEKLISKYDRIKMADIQKIRFLHKNSLFKMKKIPSKKATKKFLRSYQRPGVSRNMTNKPFRHDKWESNGLQM